MGLSTKRISLRLNISFGGTTRTMVIFFVQLNGFCANPVTIDSSALTFSCISEETAILCYSGIVYVKQNGHLIFKIINLFHFKSSMVTRLKKYWMHFFFYRASSWTTYKNRNTFNDISENVWKWRVFKMQLFSIGSVYRNKVHSIEVKQSKSLV